MNKQIFFPALLLLTHSLLFTQALAADDEILFGSVAMDVPASMHNRLKPLTEYLSQQLKRPVSLKLSADMGSAIKENTKGGVHLSYLTPVAYIKAHEKGGAQLIAKTVTNGKASFQLMIVVREDSDIRSVDDLAGKSFAFGDKRALLQQAAVSGAGIDREKFSEYKYVGHYDNIARGVYSGDFDAGILKDTTALKWKDKGLRIIYSTPDLPPYNIAASKKVDARLLKQLREAFLALDKNIPQHLLIIKALDAKYDGFASTSDAEYNVIRELIAKLK